MLSKIKTILRKNKFIFCISRIIYKPIKAILLIQPKMKCRNEAEELLQEYDSTKPTIFFFGVPLHKNLGDFAQTDCTMRYFEKYWPEYQVLAMKSYSAYSKRYISLLKSKIKKEDIIFFQSGYCSTDRHLDHFMHIIIVKEFKNNKIVFMPQTVLFNSKKEIYKTRKIFESHNKMLFMTRDIISYEYAHEIFPNMVIECYPDIVTTLIGTRTVMDNREGILMCLRNDYEKLYQEQDLERLKTELTSITNIVDTTDTSCDDIDYVFALNNIGKIVDDKISLFSKYRLIITDRYHGTIFSLIANVPVIVIASNDHKVVTGVDWFKGIYDGNYYLAQTLDDALNKAKELYYKDEVESNKSYFEEHYYSKLRKIVDEI